jgi:hypothetical protein
MSYCEREPLGAYWNLRRVPADKIRSAQRETDERVACADYVTSRRG